MAIVGAAFIVTWAAEAAEKDLPQSLAIGLVALIAVMPEYAIDAVFAWKGGKDPSYIPFATANMTGANRLLIGVGWPAVLFASWWSGGSREVRLTSENFTEFVTLLAATLYCFLLPIKGSLSILDAAVLISIFGFYAWRSSQAAHQEPELEGLAAIIGELPAAARRLTVLGMFLFSAFTIYVSAEPFAEGLLAAGRHWGIEEFLLVQWLAPLASEAPEFIVAIVFSLKGKAGVALRALLSSKVNQWTLLVGMLPLFFSASGRSLAPMPMNGRQVEELFLTAAQSLFGLVLLLNLRLSAVEAASLLILFLAQILFPSPAARYAFAGLYLFLALILFFAQRPRRLAIRTLIDSALGRVVASILMILAVSAAAGAQTPGRALFEAAGCRACHRVGEAGGNAGPDLTYVGFRRSRAWLDAWLEDPHAWKKDTLMPNFKLAPKTREAIVDFLVALKGEEYPPGRAPWDDPALFSDAAARGKVLYLRAGCVACHGPQGRGGHPNNNVAGDAIPALAGVAQTFTREELKSKISRGVLKPDRRDPAGPEPMVFMPAWGQTLKDADIDAVAAYLMTLGGGPKSAEW